MDNSTFLNSWRQGGLWGQGPCKWGEGQLGNTEEASLLVCLGPDPASRLPGVPIGGVWMSISKVPDSIVINSMSVFGCLNSLFN